MGSKSPAQKAKLSARPRKDAVSARSEPKSKMRRKVPGSKAKKKPWNFGKKHSVSKAQHIIVDRKDVDLWLAALLYIAGPVYAVSMYLGLVTGRRISEIVRLRGKDFCLSGGELCDHPYIRIEAREHEKQQPGLGKVPDGCAVARIGKCVIDSIEGLLQHGLSLSWECRDALEPYKLKHKDIFDKVKPMSKKKFMPAPLEEDALWFPAVGPSKQKWRTRQSIWNGVKATRSFMFKITGKRCFNPDPKFNGSHVHVHGATRHSNAALLMWNPDSKQNAPNQTTILELQQRADAQTFRKHYMHAAEKEIQAALHFGSIGSPFMVVATGSLPGKSAEPLGVERDSQEPTPAVAALPSSSNGPEAEHPSLPEDTEGKQVKSHCSRNAWRKAKRKAGKAQHLRNSDG